MNIIPMGRRDGSLGLEWSHPGPKEVFGKLLREYFSLPLERGGGLFDGQFGEGDSWVYE